MTLFMVIVKNYARIIMSTKFFITGTDTGSGKTLVTAALTLAIKKKGIAVIALKPVAAGGKFINQQLQNTDALILMEAMDNQLPYENINPIIFEEAIAPHLAAEKLPEELSVGRIQSACDLSAYNAETILIEGAGGWLVPLNDNQTFADYVVAESLSVIMVVGMKLGCINHALLTGSAIKHSGAILTGWVANCIDPNMDALQQNIQTLKQHLDAPLIGAIPRLNEDSIQQASHYFNLDLFIKNNK